MLNSNIILKISRHNLYKRSKDFETFSLMSVKGFNVMSMIPVCSVSFPEFSSCSYTCPSLEKISGVSTVSWSSTSPSLSTVSMIPGFPWFSEVSVRPEFPLLSNIVSMVSLGTRVSKSQVSTTGTDVPGTSSSMSSFPPMYRSS